MRLSEEGHNVTVATTTAVESHVNGRTDAGGVAPTTTSPVSRNWFFFVGKTQFCNVTASY